MSVIEYRLFPTVMGWAGVLGVENRISRLVLPRESRSIALSHLMEGMAADCVETEIGFSAHIEQLTAYFAGERADLTCEPDLSVGSDFDRSVWAAAREIGYGEVRTYSWIARHIGSPHAARAVGSALGRNPVLVIVPCHRVIREDGGLGGFSAGIEWKNRLLALESASERGLS